MRSTMRVRALLAGGAAAVTLTTAAYAAPAYDAAAWQADYAQLKQIMEQDYANLAWFASPQGGLDLPALDRKTEQSLHAARSDAEARQAIAAFVAAFRGGHFSVLSPVAGGSGTPPSVVAPKPFDAQNAGQACAALGFLPTARVAFSLPLETLPNFELVSDGLASVYRSGIVTTAGGRRIGVVRIQNFRLRAFPAACTLAFEAARANGAKIDAQSLRDASDEKWLSALSAQVAALRSAGISALLIDIGDNSGGDDHGDLFPRLLTSRPVRSARLMMAASHAARSYVDEQLQSLDRAIATAPPQASREALTQARNFFVRAGHEAETPCDMSWVWRQQRPWTDTRCRHLVDVGYAGGYAATLPQGAFGDQNIAYRLSYASGADEFWGLWTGPLYVLTDGQTYSAAEMFAAVVQDNRIGKTIGVTTGGDGCGFMAGDMPHALSHSRMRLRIPDCLRLRADGSNEVSGIAPDIPVLPTEGEDARQRSERLIDDIAADMR